MSLKVRYDSRIACRKLCPCGNDCCLDAYTTQGKPHALHICNDDECKCHSMERYDGLLGATRGRIQVHGNTWVRK